MEKNTKNEKNVFHAWNFEFMILYLKLKYLQVLQESVFSSARGTACAS